MSYQKSQRSLSRTAGARSAGTIMVNTDVVGALALRRFLEEGGSSLYVAFPMSFMSESSPHTSISFDVVAIYILETPPRYGLANSVAEYSSIDGAVRKYSCVKITTIR